MSWLLYLALLAILAVLGAYFFVTPFLFVFLMRVARRACGFTHRKLKVDNEQWHYLDGGDRDAAVMVLLHGFGANKDTWLPYARLLTNKYRVLVPDLPGFGESPQIMNKDYRSHDQAQRLHRLMQRLGIDRYHVSGNSMGGLIAARLALAHPESVISLTLFNNAGIEAPVRTPFYDQMLKGEATLVIRSQEDFEQILPLISYRPLKLPKGFLKLVAQDAIARADLMEKIFSSLRAEILEDYLNEHLPEIKAPTLVLWGKQDRLFDYEAVNVMAEKLPDCHIVLLESTGHTPMIERPTDTVRHQLQFLETRANMKSRLQSGNESRAA